MNKALSIAETLYLGYLLSFLLDSNTSHSIYTKNALCSGEMNKNSKEK